MASLRIVKGQNQGQDVPLTTDRTTFGRNPECTVVIPVTSVSREHAQISVTQGKWFIEDLQSRNGTFVNNQPIAARTLLKNNDKIRICDFLATFLDTRGPAGIAAAETTRGGRLDDRRGILSHTSHMLLETQPAEKLRPCWRSAAT